MKILGVIIAYNEEDCIGNAVRALRRCCDVVDVLDHGSTDDTGDIARDEGASVWLIDRKRVPPADENGAQSIGLWRETAEHIRRNIGGADWVVFNSADDLLREPDGRLATHEGIEREAARGTEVIRPLIRLFDMTRSDDPEDVCEYLCRMNRYKENRRGHSPRAWRIDLTPEELPLGGHIQDPSIVPKVHDFYGVWPEGTVVSNNEWLIDQYPFRSRAQAERKILHERAWISPTGVRRFSHLVERGRVRFRAVIRNASTRTLETRSLEMP